VAWSYGKDGKKTTKYGKKMWEKLERHAKMKKMIGKRYQWK
jgi:hypothetical protein